MYNQKKTFSFLLHLRTGFCFHYIDFTPLDVTRIKVGAKIQTLAPQWITKVTMNGKMKRFCDKHDSNRECICFVIPFKKFSKKIRFLHHSSQLMVPLLLAIIAITYFRLSFVCILFVFSYMEQIH